MHVRGTNLKFAFFLNLGIILVELVGGLMANSLALLGDAGHNATDAFAIGLAWFAQTQARKTASARMTYGYYRSGILVALANALSLVVIALFLGWEAYQRLLHPEPIAALPLFVAAGLGLILNTWAALGLRGGEDINVRSAFLHLLGDAVASAGVIIGGVVIYITGWHWIDPLLSVAIAVLIAVGAWDVVRRTVQILMEGTPEGIVPTDVAATIAAMEGVRAVHDVHLWSLDGERSALTCHVVVDCQRTVGDMRPLLADLSRHLSERFRIGHTTVQLECSHAEHDADACGIPARELGPAAGTADAPRE